MPGEIGISPELAVLAAILSPICKRPPTPDLQLDWDKVVRLAERHRVVPALAHAVANGAYVVPEHIQPLLIQRAQQAAFEELALAGTLRELLVKFEAANISIVILKGVPLSLMIHGRLGLRFSRDIDILVAPEHAAAAQQILQEIAFLPRSSGKASKHGDFESLMRQRKDIELVNDARRQIVELHWRLFDNPHLLALSAHLPARSVALPGGLNCHVLPERLNMLYLASHGAQHAWSRLKWLADFAALVAASTPEEIDQLHACTSHAEGQRGFTQALMLCEMLFAMPVPPRIREIAECDWRVRMLLRVAIKNLVNSGETEIEALPSSTTAKNISHYLLRSSPAYLMREAWFDLNDFSNVPANSVWRRFGPFGRVGMWLARKVSRRSSGGRSTP